MPHVAANVADYLLDGRDVTAPALLELERAYTYGELQTATTDIAAFLINSGAQKGERALLAAENGFFWVAAYLGILRAGLVCVPLPAGISQDNLQHIVATAEPRFAMVQWKFAAKNAADLGGITVVLESDLPLGISLPAVTFAGVRQSGVGATVKLPDVRQTDLAALMFTSGSTGKPRGVMVSHGNIICNTESIIEYLKLTVVDRILAVLPFHYCFGTSLLHTHLRVGGSVVIEPRFMFPPKVLERMQQDACTGFAGVPSHFQILLRKSALARTGFPHLRYVQQAGGHLAPTFVKELRAALPGVAVYVMYGQTEATARLSYLPPDMLAEKPGSIGKGIPGVLLTVLDETGAPVRPGEVGEVVAEGGNITQGYWRDPQESAASFRNGRLHTGDLATVDEEGFIYIVDRAKDFLKCGGKRVSCREIEDIILEYPDVLEVAVVGVPDDVLGEAAMAYVVPRDRKTGLSVDGLRAFCKEHLAPQVVPQGIVVMERLPKNTSGKVLKAEIKAKAAPAQG